MRYSKLANELWPFLRQDVEKVVTNGAASRGGGSGGLTVHSLSEAFHIGTLDDSQAPQFLKTDGTRALTGNLAVNSGVTIDGVDISAHAAATGASVHGLGTISTQNANSVAITGGSVTGVTDIAIADGGTGASTAANARTNLGLGTANSPTFAGLTINGNIGVTGTVDGVDVSAHKSRHESGGADAINHDSLTGFVANEHIDHTAVSITAGNGLTGGGTIASSRTLNVGAGNGISVAADSVAVNQAYDFTWTGLHTFDNHTEMDSVDINGALTVSDDLTVFYGGYSPLFVNVDTINPNNSNVGIMPQNLPGGVPDPQFALDVGGPLRAQYLIGPHAIQLSDAAMICHFDGPTPYTTNFDGSAVGHLGQVPTVTGGAIYRPGKFGKGAQLAEATTNLITNPSFEINLSGWSTSGGERWTHGGKYGDCHLAAGVVTFTSVAVTNGETYTVSFWHQGYYSVNLDFGNSVLNYRFGTNTTVGSDGWALFTETFVASGTTFTIYLYDHIYDAVQLEQKAYATPYCDGSLGSGHSWSGTPHASTSSRSTASTVYDDIGIANGSPFTVMFWLHQFSASGKSAQWIIYVDGLSGNWIINSTTVLEIYDTDAATYRQLAAAIPQNEWAHVALVSDGATLTPYINGSAGAYPRSLAIGIETLYLRNTASGDQFQANYVIDDLTVLSRAADAAEIRSIYESDAPVFAESSIEVWRTPTQVPIWVDSEGMWMRSVGGGETLGAYGGDATKSWGGKTLYQSDFLLGNATDGYIHWHAFQDDSDPWGEAGMEVKAQVDVTGSSTISGELALFDGASTRLFINSSYMLAGANAGNDATSFAVIFEDTTQVGTDPSSPTYNTGDVLIGDELSANILWDDSLGQLLFRDNDTTRLYVDTDGSLKAGAGAVTLDETGLSINTATTTTINTFNRVEWLSGGTSAAFIGAYHVSGATSAGVFVSNFTNGNFEIRGNGSSSGTVRLMASSGGVGSIGDGNVFGANIVLNDNGTTESIGFDADIFNFGGGPLSLTEISTTPATPTSGTQMRLYMKADKLIAQYNDGGTVRYKYLDLTGTGVTWVHTTTAP